MVECSIHVLNLFWGEFRVFLGQVCGMGTFLLGDACVPFFFGVLYVWRGNMGVGRMRSIAALQSSRGGGQCAGEWGRPVPRVDSGFSTRIRSDPVVP